MHTSKLLKSSMIAAAITLGAAASYAAAPQLLLDFQFNEGQGLTSKSSVGDTVLTLGEPVDPSWTPVSTENSPSGAAGDLALDVTSAHGWLYTELEENPIDLTQPFSWECWVYVDPDSVQTYEDYFRLGGSLKAGTDNNHQFELTFCGVEDVTSSWVVSGGYWTHLALAWQPGISVNFYVDGVWVDEIVTENMPATPSSNILTIASSNDGGSIFDGMLDRMRFHQGIPEDVYDPGDYFDCDPANPKALSKDTVLAFDFNETGVPYKSTTAPTVTMQSGPDLIGDTTQIKFDESTPVRDVDPVKGANDYSVFVDNSAVTDNYADKYGKFSTEALGYDDTSDASFTLEAWFKGLSKSSLKQVFFQTWSSSNANVPRVSFAINTDFTVYFTTMGVRDIYTGAKIPEDGGWHHIAVSFDQPNRKIKVYVDGELASEEARNYSATGAVLSTEADFGVNFATQASPYEDVGMIGAEYSGWAPFTGHIDRMRFWKGVVAQEDLDYEYYGEAIISPTFKTQPTSLTAPAGTPVRFTSAVVGTDNEEFPMSFQWYKDGKAIEGATEVSYQTEATEATAGTYTLVATNAKGKQGGTTTSKEVTLALTDKTPKAPTKLIDFDFTEGKGITTTSAVGGLVGTLGTEYAYDPETDDNTIVADSFFSAKDTVMKSIGKSWLKSELYETSLLDTTKPFTLETWVYIDPENDKTFEGYIVVDNSIKIGTDSNHDFEMTFYGVADITSGIIVPAGEWHHYAASYDPDAVFYNDEGEEKTGVVYFYLDGAWMGEVGQETAPLDKATKQVLIGGESGWPMWGCMNRARVHQGIASDPYDATSYLDCDAQNPKPVKKETVLSYSFDSAAFPQVNEVSPAIELTNAGAEYAETQNAKNVQWSEDDPSGKDGVYSLEFSGSNNVTFDGNYLKIDRNDSSFTVEAWVKTELSTLQIIIANKGMDARFSFSMENDNVRATTYGVKDYTLAGAIPNDGDWHHIAFALDWQGEWVYGYVDGALVYSGDVYVYSSDDGYKSMKFDDASGVGLIGSEGSGFFTGNITRVRVHSGVVAGKDLDYYNVDKGTAPIIESLDIPAVVAGEEATLSVTASGKEPMAYQWYKDGVAIDGATEATYVIEEAAMTDAGSYSVEISNALGETTSEATLMPVSSAAENLETLLSFQLNEFQGNTIRSSIGGATGTFNIPPIMTAAGVSGAYDDYAVELTGKGYFVGQAPEEFIDLAKGTVTFEGWIYAESAAGYQDFFRFGKSLKAGISNGKFQMTLLGVVDITSSIDVPVQEWTHLAVSFVPGEGATFFMNGQQVETIGSTSAAKAITDPVLSLGADQNGGSPFTGKLDRIRLGFTALTEETLDADPANPMPATNVVEFAFNTEYNGTAVSEDGSIVLAGTTSPIWITGPYIGEGNIDGALTFCGDSIPFNTDNINFGDTTDKSFSVEAWVEIPVRSTRQVFVVLLGNETGTCPRISASITAAGTLMVTTLGIADFDTGVSVPCDGAWHNVAAAWNQPAGIMYVFVDGKLAGSKAYTSGVNFNVNENNAGALGGELSGTYTYGSVDRVKVWKGVVGPTNLDYPASAPEAPIVPAVINWGVEDNTLTISWEDGGLEVSSDNINWTPIDQTSPLSIDLTTTTGNKYYRIAK